MRLIDADALIADIKECMEAKDANCEWDQMEGLKVALSCIDETPTAQPEQQWIPVSEKYPPVDEEVLVTYSVDQRKRRYVDIAHWSGNDWLSMLDEYRVPGHAIRYHAWKPLPKPYKGGI